MDPIQLVVGLGNPGDKYAATRHNAGFWCLDRLAARGGAEFKGAARMQGEMAEIHLDGRRARLLKPTTFMNHSGQAVGAAAKFYRIAPASILVVHDEIDLPAGTVRVKIGGGHGGHNGLRDIISHLGSNAFVRVRLGVGHPGQREEVVGHVLKRAGQGEQSAIDDAIERVLAEFSTLLAGDAKAVMNVLNRRESAVPQGGN